MLLRGPDAERPYEKRQALHQQQDAEDERHGDRRRHRTREEQHADQDVDHAEDKGPGAAAAETLDELKDAHHQPLNPEHDDKHRRDQDRRDHRMAQDGDAREHADNAAEERLPSASAQYDQMVKYATALRLGTAEAEQVLEGL